jgi:leader peptidase (prepilin peptidase) / N-methyltransferase
MLDPSLLEAGLAGLFGLLVGSFLNVVIYRLPLVMQREWWLDVAGMLTDADSYRKIFASPLPETALSEGKRLELRLNALPRFSLAAPRSRCPACGHAIRWWENVPVLSYVFLRGKCSACGAHISVRYPIVELLCGAVFAGIALRWGLTWQGAAWAVFACILIAQFLIDFDTQFLPDDLNYILLWLGLAVAALGWSVPLSQAVWGAIAGYLSLWVVYQIHFRITGRAGMGHGDFKLLAALGAWFGAKFLFALILLSSVVGTVVGLALIVIGRIANRHIPFAFGPFLAGAGLVAMALGPDRVRHLIPFAFPF